MILTTSLLVVLLGGTSTTLAAPVSRSQRDADLFTEALGPWFKECQNQSGGQYCVELAYKGVSALGANAAVCAQQDIADTMIDFAKTLTNNTALISQTRIYAQQPRSSADGMAVLYCQDAPTSTELSGVYPCQSAEFDLTKFTGSVTVGAAGTIPFGLTAAVNPAGSCPDRDTPVPAGEFLTDQANKSASHKSKTNSKATTSTSGTQRKSGYKHMTLLQYVKRQEEGGGDEGAAEPAPEDGAETLPGDNDPRGSQTPAEEGSADPPAEGSAE
ncbi:hypothetical protein M408DRAFT_285970 [Serendipita vermifera MAFF 305830]|uniref:Uncharacterized protein n=1 Tax=Serendipita vermifera MAFF 305830 TaxID=933852 RepID=A0A0C2XN92_SERVB|nr:hypothetical protein M408DRAFT_285970 [Serendipita vermifera MAFF 305830]